MKKNFNLKLFIRLIRFTKPYKLNFIFVSFSAIIISFFSILNQYFLKIAVDEYITPKDYKGLLTIIVLMFSVFSFGGGFDTGKEKVSNAYCRNRSVGDV